MIITVITVFAIFIVTISFSSLFTRLTYSFWIIRNGDLELEQRCSKYRCYHLFRAGQADTALLEYRDVFALTDDKALQDDVRDDAGKVTSPASGIARGLRAAGIPVCVLECSEKVGDQARWERRVADVAVARTDQVTVAYYSAVHGLERRVVVWLAERRDINYFYPAFWLYGLSRCTTQLVKVDLPFGYRESQTSNIRDRHTSSEDNAGEFQTDDV